MLRTQIYLPEDCHSELTDLAQKAGVPMSEIIRKMLKVELKEKDKYLTKGNSLASLAKLKITGGPKDLSAKFDSYLYG